MGGPGFDRFMKWFFGANAFVSVVVLLLITVFLFREGIGFLPMNWRNLQVYRLAGLEYVDIIRAQVDEHTRLSRVLQALRLQQLRAVAAAGADDGRVAAALAPFDRYAAAFDAAADDLRGLVSDLGETAAAIKEKAKIAEDRKIERAQLLAAGRAADAAQVAVAEVDFAAEVGPLLAALPAYRETARRLAAAVAATLAAPPAPAGPGPAAELRRFDGLARAYLATFPATERALAGWDPRRPVPAWRSLAAFLGGGKWVTNSFWQDWYGVLPLLAGSALVALVALLVAVPFGVGAAVYVSEIATAREQRLIKPCIEFIAAIPSVVLGFFGIAVFGETVRRLSALPALASRLPFFPIDERLNVFTAGCLLALMAVPTIFSLAEDALNNVPRAYKEAACALGSTRLQTIVHIIVPTALSGIVSAVLLGFGRVIGETMVVLLCAGNRIALPDFSRGPGALFQPVHTMTGIIAQEIGEVPQGSIHWRALFFLGIVLFLISLLINGLAQRCVRRMKLATG